MLKAVLVVGVVALFGCEGPAGPMGYSGVTGPQGPAGPKGDPGAKGDPGNGGADAAKIVASIGCAGGLEDVPYDFFYSVTQFGNGNVFASGEVAGSSYGGTSAIVYSPQQNGYLDAPVIFTMDVYGTSTSGWWRLSLSRTTLVTTIQYNDGELATGKATWVMTPDKCVLNAY